MLGYRRGEDGLAAGARQLAGGSMSDEQTVSTRVRSTSSGTIGRSLNAIGTHHLVIDSPTLGEEITSIDAFLAGLSSCGVNLIERIAEADGLPLRRTEVLIDGRRDRRDTSVFTGVEMHFTLFGVTKEQADYLVGRYQAG
jgi:uncharacterized OsmC-like protein